MASKKTGIMALPEADEPRNTPQLSLDDSYDAVKTALRQVSPELSGQVETTLSGISSQIGELTPDQAAEILQILQDLYNSTPEEYKNKLAKYAQEGKMQAGDLPEEYDPEFLATAITLVLEARKTAQASQEEMLQPPEGPEGFAKGGIAAAAKLLASKGRNGDTMLAHINPQEARLLKAYGGSGTINPETGLRQYDFFSSLWKGIKDTVKSVLSNPIGRIIGTIALSTVLGPIVGPTFALPLASAGTTLLSGGSVKDAFTSAVFSYLGGPDGPLSGLVSPLTESLTGFGPTTVAGQAITSGIIGTGVGLLSGKSLADSVKSGLIQGAMTYGSGTFAKAPVRDAGPMLPGLNEQASLQGAPTLQGSEGPAAAAPLGDRGVPSVRAVNPVEAASAAQGPAQSAPAAPAPANTAPAAPAPANTAPTQAGPVAPLPGSVAPPQVPSVMDSLSQIGQGNIKEGLTNLFSPSLTNAQLRETPEYKSVVDKVGPAAALKEAAKAYDPGLLRSYGPMAAAGLGLMGAAGGFKQQPLKLSPEQQRIQDMMTGGPGSAQFLLRTDPYKYFIQNIPGVPYYNGSVYRGYADGGDVGGQIPMDIASRNSIPVGYAAGGSANIPLMQQRYRQYWETGSQPGQTINWAGGQLTRLDSTTASYYNPTTGEQVLLRPNMDFGYIASQSPSIAAQWKQEFNFVPPGMGSGTVGSVDKMGAAWSDYWSKGGKEVSWAGGKLVKSDDGKSAVYTDPDGREVKFTPDTSFSYLANASPHIAALWKKEFGYDANPSLVTGNQLRSDYSTVGVEQQGAAAMPTKSSGAASANPFLAEQDTKPTALMAHGGIAHLEAGGDISVGMPDFYQDEQGNYRQNNPSSLANEGIAALGFIPSAAPGPVQNPADVESGLRRTAEMPSSSPMNEGIASLKAAETPAPSPSPSVAPVVDPEEEKIDNWIRWQQTQTDPILAQNIGQLYAQRYPGQDPLKDPALRQMAKNEMARAEGNARVVGLNQGYGPQGYVTSQSDPKTGAIIIPRPDGTSDVYFPDGTKIKTQKGDDPFAGLRDYKGPTTGNYGLSLSNVGPWADPNWQYRQDLETAAKEALRVRSLNNPGQFVAGPGRVAAPANLTLDPKYADLLGSADPNDVLRMLNTGAAPSSVQGMPSSAQGNKISDYNIALAKDIVRLGYDPTGMYKPAVMELVRQFRSGERKLNMGGIAGIAQGGYPRRTGQISGPGTEKSDSIPAMLSDGEFVMTARAVRGAGNGSRRDGAKKMYKLMHQLERNASRG